MPSSASTSSTASATKSASLPARPSSCRQTFRSCSSTLRCRKRSRTSCSSSSSKMAFGCLETEWTGG